MLNMIVSLYTIVLRIAPVHDCALQISSGQHAHAAFFDLVARSDPTLHGLLPRRLIADMTGGTKLMTAAMVAACLTRRYAIEHVPTQ